jgi:hypothetical protein
MTPALTAKFFRARAATLRAQADEGSVPTYEARAEAAVFEEGAAELEAERGRLTESLKLAFREADEKVQLGTFEDRGISFLKWTEVPCRFSGDGREGCFAAEINRHGGPCVPCWARALLRIRDLTAMVGQLKRSKS